MSDLTNVILSNAFQRRAAEEAARRDAEQAQINAQRNLQNEVAFSMLQSLVSGLKTARSPKHVRASFATFNKSFKKLSGLDLYSEGDIQNIERMVEQESSITSQIAEVTAREVGNLLNGKTTFDQSMRKLNENIDTLSQQFGEAEVNPFTVEAYGALANALERQKSHEAGRQQLQAALRPQTQAAYQFLPELSPLVVRFEENLDALALTALSQTKFGAGVKPDMGVLREHWVLQGAASLGLAGTREKAMNMNDDQKFAALSEGERLWTEELNNYRADISTEFYDQMLPGLVGVGEAEFEQLVNLQVRIANEAVGTELFSLIDLDTKPLLDRISQLKEKYERGTPTDLDQQRIARSIDGLKVSGLLDVSGIEFSSMSEGSFARALEDGRVEGALRRVQGPSGANLWNLIFDDAGLVRPYADTLLMLDHDKLARGDEVAWSTAEMLSSDRDPGRFKVTDPKTGKDLSIWGALYQSEEQDSDSLRKRAQASAMNDFMSTMTETPRRVTDFLFGGILGGGVGGSGKSLETLAGVREAATKRVDDAVAAMDEATLTAIRTGDASGVEELTRDLFRTPGTPAGKRDQAMTAVVEDFTRAFQPDEGVDRRISSLRESIRRSAAIPKLADQEAERSAGLAQAQEKGLVAQDENVKARMKAISDSSQVATRISGPRPAEDFRVPSLKPPPVPAAGMVPRIGQGGGG